MEQVSVVAGNFAQHLSLKFLSIFMPILNSIEPITLISLSLLSIVELLSCRVLIIAILIKGDDIRNGTKGNACHRQYRSQGG